MLDALAGSVPSWLPAAGWVTCLVVTVAILIGLAVYIWPDAFGRR